MIWLMHYFPYVYSSLSKFVAAAAAIKIVHVIGSDDNFNVQLIYFIMKGTNLGILGCLFLKFNSITDEVKTVSAHNSKTIKLVKKSFCVL